MCGDGQDRLWSWRILPDPPCFGVAVARNRFIGLPWPKKIAGNMLAIGTLSFTLRREADLFHESLVIPEQVLLIHHAVLPVPDGAHYQLESLARRRNGFAVANGHGLCVRSL